MGEAQPRTVVSGLVKYISLEEMQVSLTSLHIYTLFVYMLKDAQSLGYPCLIFLMMINLSESEGLCSLQSETGNHEGNKIPSDGSLCL